VRYVTDERVGEGTVGSFSVATNLVLKEIGTPPFFRRGISDWDHIHEHAKAEIKRNDIRTPSEKTQVAKLSGGNIQKVLLARELNAEASVVIFNKPTYGSTCRTPSGARAHPRRRGAGTGDGGDLDRSRRAAGNLRPHRRDVPGAPGGRGGERPDVERKVGLLMTGAKAA
jgi:simple sugar transport system ATP-binding protein